MSRNSISKEDAKQWIRLAKLLSKRMKPGFRTETIQDRLVVKTSARDHSFEEALVRKLISLRYLEFSSEFLVLTDAGLLDLKQRLGLELAGNHADGAALPCDDAKPDSHVKAK